MTPEPGLARLHWHPKHLLMTNPQLDIARLGGTTMGTSWSVSLTVPRSRDLHPLHAGIQAQLDRVVAQMSTWEPTSDLSRYNRAAAGSWHPLPLQTRQVLAAAQDVAAASDGAFDPTLGPLVALWGFGAHAAARSRPDPQILAATRARCGWQRLQWQGDALLQPGGLELDLSAIAKGFGVDEVVRWLQDQHVSAALVEVGGELHGYGRKADGQPWRVLVESAPEEDVRTPTPPRVLALDGKAIATSGDRWHHYQQDGEPISHSVDPRSGLPVQRAAAAVTVVADNAMHADAWATALTVLGRDAGLELATRLQLAARFLQRSSEGPVETLSPAFQALLP
mgnify:CR=1 FL=1